MLPEFTLFSMTVLSDPLGLVCCCGTLSAATNPVVDVETGPSFPEISVPWFL